MIDIEQLVKTEYEKAKTFVVESYRGKVSADRGATGLATKAIFVTKEGEVTDPYIFSWEKNENKRRMGQSVALLAAMLDVAAVITICEACAMKCETTKEPFRSMLKSANGDMRKMMDLIGEWRMKNFGPHLWDLPDEYVDDTILVVGLSEFGTFSMAGSFQRHAKPIVVVDHELPMEYEVEHFLVPRWWEAKFTEEERKTMTLFREMLPSLEDKNAAIRRFTVMAKALC